MLMLSKKDQYKANLQQNSINKGHSTEAYPKERITQKPTPQPNWENKYTSRMLGAQWSRISRKRQRKEVEFGGEGNLAENT
jgi:hypothetical protein